MPKAPKFTKASAARMVHRRYQTAKYQPTRDHVLEELESLLAEAVVCSRGTMTRIIGGPTEADQIMVYAFDDNSILVIPKAGRAYVARNRHDRGTLPAAAGRTYAKR